jgi:thiol-disulfide isomerase/thioredoxin
MTRVICAFVALFTSVALAADLPRYKLPVGRVLSYSSVGKSKEQDGRETTSSASFRLIVTAQNPDGSSHIIIRSGSTYDRTEERVTLGYVDLSPDGRFEQNPTLGPQLSVGSILPQLPANDTEFGSQWQSFSPFGSATTTYKVESDSNGQVVISAAEDGPMNRIYVTTQKQTMQFDRAKGAFIESNAEESQDYGFHSKGTATMKLDKDQTLEPEKLATLAKDYGAFFAAKDQYDQLTRKVGEEPASAEKLMNDAKAVLEQAWGAVSTAEVQAELGRMKKQHDEYAKYTIESAQKQAQVLNKEASDWSAQDLDGKEWKLSDLKGKVVVMDFWYRGCGWCMYAMPQVRQLSVDYKDKPVVFFGMNTDQKEEDAKFVVKEFDLKYPIIKAKEIPQKYGVQGFPTLVIVDQKGNVAAFDVGYSPNLHDKVSKKLDELLKAPG